MASPGEIATRGVATLGSAISGDWLGVGASVLSILRESLQGTDAEVWRKHLEKLARRGWQNAADARVTYKHLGAEADQDTSVAYVMSCLHAGTSPTAEGLIAFPGVGLVDATDLGEPMAMESAKDAANRFLSMMIGSLLSDRARSSFRTIWSGSSPSRRRRGPTLRPTWHVTELLSPPCNRASLNSAQRSASCPPPACGRSNERSVATGSSTSCRARSRSMDAMTSSPS